MSVDRRLYEIPVSLKLDDIDPSERITLPHDVPAPPSLAQLPPSILHSATVETLIGQNEDLHARLTVTIRLNAQLERRLMDLEQNQSDQRNMNGSLISQMQIVQEKEASSKARFDELEQIVALKTYESERHQVEIDLLTKQYNDKCAAFEGLRARLLEASSHIESQETSMGALHAELTAEFEGRIASVLAEHNRQSMELKDLQKRAAHLEKLDESRIEIENRAIYLERRAGELEGKFSNELGEIQTQLDYYRIEAKALAAAAQTKTNELNERTREAMAAQAALTQIEDQFESLQTIWHEGQRTLDETRLKNEALMKINAELSRKLKELRRVDGFSPDSRPNEQIEVATTSTRPPADESAPGLPTFDTKIDRIESLLANIQAGFPQSIIENDKSVDRDESYSNEASGSNL